MNNTSIGRFTGPLHYASDAKRRNSTAISASIVRVVLTHQDIAELMI
jgi:hypothetical protein